MPSNAKNNYRVKAKLYHDYIHHQPYQNYDFYTNWPQVHALLIKPEAEPYLLDFKRQSTRNRGIRHFDPNKFKSLANYSFPNGWYWERPMEIKELLVNTPVEELKVTPELKQILTELKIKLEQESDDSYFDLIDECDLLRLAGYCPDVNPSHIGFWMVRGECHTLNPSVGMYLAKNLLPHEDWRVVTSDDHTSIVSLTSRRMFDMVAWIWADKKLGHEDDRVWQIIKHELLGTELDIGGDLGAQASLDLIFGSNDFNVKVRGNK